MKTFEEVFEVMHFMTVRDIEPWWKTLGDGTIICHLNMNDMFYWGCADSELVEPDDLPYLEAALKECEAFGNEYQGELLYAARKRNQRP